MTEKLKWRVSDVIAYLEYKILHNEETEDELAMYENYKWSGKINRHTYEFKCVLKEMRDQYNGGF